MNNASKKTAYPTINEGISPSVIVWGCTIAFKDDSDTISKGHFATVQDALDWAAEKTAEISERCGTVAVPKSITISSAINREF